jgi:hypothetical protein
MPDERVDLAEERARTTQWLESRQKTHVPLAVAAAFAVLETCQDATDAVARHEYHDALNLAAAALSRFVPIFSLSDGQAQPVRIAADLRRARFVNGAAELYFNDGTAPTRLCVQREDLPQAVAAIQRAGLPFDLTG